MSPLEPGEERPEEAKTPKQQAAIGRRASREAYDQDQQK